MQDAKAIRKSIPIGNNFLIRGLFIRSPIGIIDDILKLPNLEIIDLLIN